LSYRLDFEAGYQPRQKKQPQAKVFQLKIYLFL